MMKFLAVAGNSCLAIRSLIIFLTMFDRFPLGSTIVVLVTLKKTNIHSAWVEEEARVALRLGLRLKQLLRIFRTRQTSRVLHISMNAQLKYEPTVL